MRKYKSIAFVTDGDVGLNLSVAETENGGLELMRVCQTANPTKTKPPEQFELRADERTALLGYLREMIFDK